MTVPLRRCPGCDTPLSSGVLHCPSCGASAPTQPATPPDGLAEVVDAVFAQAHMHEDLQYALGPDFEVRRMVGTGGFGEVWEAYDRRLQRAVAVKVLKPELALSSAFRERFRREARAVARLRHPGIVPIYHVGEAHGLVFFIMPLVEGVTLKQALDADGRLSPEESVRVLAEASSALREAHRRGIVHRDLKPENFMLEGQERRVLLMDFGIAQSEEGERRLTGAGLVLGSPEYMSPEQATGVAQLDGRSDLYSLGVVAYRMLAGRLPFDAESSREILAKHVLTPPEPLSGFVTVPPALSDAIMRCLAKQPDERWQTADELLEALGMGVQGRSSGAAILMHLGTATEVSPVSPVSTQRGRFRRAALVGTGTAVVAVAAGAWALIRWADSRRWEQASAAVSAAYGAAADSLRLLADAFRGGRIAGTRYLAERTAVRSAADSGLEEAWGPILADLSAWPPALRPGVRNAMQEVRTAGLAGAALDLQESPAVGCQMERRQGSVVLRDIATGSNCWWSPAGAPRVAGAVEYAVTVSGARAPPADAGFGLAWCGSATACRVLFVWLRGRVEWATFSPGAGLRSRQLGAQLRPLVGEHSVRVRTEAGRSRVWVDGRVVLQRAARDEAALLTRAELLRVVVQNASVELTGPGAVTVVGDRP